MRISSLFRWLAISLLLCGHNSLAQAVVEESCTDPASCFGDIFEDEQPLSLLQRKASQVQAHRPSSGVAAEKTASVDAALQPVEVQELPLSLLQQGATVNHASESSTHADETVPQEDMEADSSSVPLKIEEASPLKGISSWPELDTKSRLYSIHTISTMVKERGQIGVLVVGCMILVLLWAPSMLKSGKKDKPAAPVQVRVDHFVTHSQPLTTKRDVPKTLSMAEAVYHTNLPEGVESTVELSTDASAVGAMLTPSRSPPKTPSRSPREELRRVSCAPLDPFFVLPLCETWYGVCVEPFAMCDGNFDILRIAGFPVLHGAVRHADGFRLLEITCSGLPAKQGQILVRVAIECRPPVEDSKTTEVTTPPAQAPTALKVDGLDGKPYGHLRLEADGSYSLVCGEDTVISLAAEDGQHLVARAAGSKKELAQASWFEQSDYFSGAGHMAVRINPNEDTLLVLACTLALTILGGANNLLHFSRPAESVAV